MGPNDQIDHNQANRFLQGLLSLHNGGASTSAPQPEGSQQSTEQVDSGNDSPSTSPAATSSSSSIPSPPMPEAFADGNLDFNRVIEALNNPQSANLSLNMLMRDFPTTSADSTNATSEETVDVKEKMYKPRNSRMKVFADDYFMTFDKKSSCGTKNFWRCERKNECPARMHTQMDSCLILKRIHPHNHLPPTPAELSFYDLDLKNPTPDHVIPVNSVSRSIHKCRRLSRVFEAAGQPLPGMMMLERPTTDVESQGNPAIESVQTPTNLLLASTEPPASLPTLPMLDPAALLSQFQIQSSPRMAPETRPDMQMQSNAAALMAQFQKNMKLLVPKTELPYQQSPTSSQFSQSSSSQVDGHPPPPKKRKAAEPLPDFREMYKMVKGLHDHFLGGDRIIDKNTPSTSYASSTPLVSESFVIYVSMLNEEEDDSEQNYHLLKVANKSLVSLRLALEHFVGKFCTQNILVSISPKINFVVSDMMISDWETGKIFKLDTRKSKNGWKLIPVEN